MAPSRFFWPPPSASGQLGSSARTAGESPKPGWCSRCTGSAATSGLGLSRTLGAGANRRGARSARTAWSLARWHRDGGPATGRADSYRTWQPPHDHALSRGNRQLPAGIRPLVTRSIPDAEPKQAAWAGRSALESAGLRMTWFALTGPRLLHRVVSARMWCTLRRHERCVPSAFLNSASLTGWNSMSKLRHCDGADEEHVPRLFPTVLLQPPRPPVHPRQYRG